MAEERVQRKLAAIVSADVVGYSRMMGQDETGTLARLKSLRAELLHPKVAEYGGRIVKTTGDGTLIEFGSAVDAVSHAVDVQTGMAERNESLADTQKIHLRLGINVGDIIIDGDDIYGDGVNVAARLEAMAEPGGICISARVHDYVGGRLDLGFDDLGPQTLKNIAEPVHVYRVRLGAGVARTSDPLSEAPLDAPPLPDKPSIAVLPFTNMSGDPEQEYFSDGISEDIITDLSKVSGVFVIARNSSFVYKGNAVSVRDVGRELGVQYVLEGSVRRAGNRLRITGQLIDCATDRHLWAERFDRDLDDVFAVQEEVARRVVDALEVTLMPEEGARLARIPTRNIEAYETFIRARMAVHPPSEENLASARRLFEQTVALDPDFAGGYAGLSFAGMLGLQFGHVERSPELIDQVTELAQKAVDMDEELGYAFTALGAAKWMVGDHEAAIAAGRQAARLQPGDAEIQASLGLFLIYGGAPRDAIPHIERALRLSPRNPGVYLNFYAYAHAMAGNSETAIATFDRILPNAYSTTTFAMSILAYAESGDMRNATKTAELALERYPNMTVSMNTSHFFRRHDDIERMSRALRASGIPD